MRVQGLLFITFASIRLRLNWELGRMRQVTEGILRGHVTCMLTKIDLGTKVITK